MINEGGVVMQAIIKKTEDFVRDLLGDDCTGHDWYHIERVRKNALYIYEKENRGDRLIIELAALLHDVSDEKLNPSKEEGERKLFTFLDELQLEQSIRNKVIEVINSVSFKGGKKTELKSIEAMIVQDADRLDAIGAIGIARTFAYGGSKGRQIYSPDIPVRDVMTEEEYRKGNSPSIHHFYEKLLKLKDLLNTDTAKEIAEKRHQLMENYLEEFFNEWNGQF